MMEIIVIGFVIYLGLLLLSLIIGGSWLAGEPFVCPNCGHRFYAKWYQMLFKRYTVRAFNQARIKCPNCKIRDMCGRPYNSR